MALIRWEPARELQSLQQEMNRLFGTFSDPQVGAGSGAAGRWIPAMDLVEQGEEYILRADLPGLAEDDVKVELEGDVLTISGERRSERTGAGEGYRRLERATGRFSRSLTLPEGVDPASVEARFERGVLEVRIPKPRARKPHRVAINVAGGAPAVEGTAPDVEGAAPAGEGTAPAVEGTARESDGHLAEVA
ncbi:MAG TPA: Hsp20/alpha crystallin family protein [Solirubrobacteraceae bacterium]|nr:Hsp20/alpha crystallin family protein [Solirubrobacteraceae bacterium]